jgi:hypothetical protein
LLLCALGLVLGSACTADLDELDSCYDVASSYCGHLSGCSLITNEADCRSDVGRHCAAANTFELDASASADCASDLEAMASCDDLPKSCEGLAEHLGCNSCGSAPTAGLRKACCNADRFSPVCGGC